MGLLHRHSTATGNIWSAYQAIKHIYYGADWKKDIITPQTQFFSDVSNGKLRAVSWITPTCGNSDHAGCGSNKGPSWVASLVNAVGESQYWKSTAIFIFWDDYGGWFDPEPPTMLDYDGLGLRIPMVIVSPYAKKNYVSHVQYEHGSILRFIEDLFGLGQLCRERRTRDLAGERCVQLQEGSAQVQSHQRSERQGVLYAPAARHAVARYAVTSLSKETLHAL